MNPIPSHHLQHTLGTNLFARVETTKNTNSPPWDPSLESFYLLELECAGYEFCTFRVHGMGYPIQRSGFYCCCCCCCVTLVVTVHVDPMGNSSTLHSPRGDNRTVCHMAGHTQENGTWRCHGNHPSTAATQCQCHHGAVGSCIVGRTTGSYESPIVTSLIRGHICLFHMVDSKLLEPIIRECIPLFLSGHDVGHQNHIGPLHPARRANVIL